MSNAFKPRKAAGIVVLFVLACVTLAAAHAIAAAPPAAKSTAPVTSPAPKQDMIYATGEGAMPTVAEEPNRAKAYLKAKGYAKMQAIANLVQSVRGTAITYRATGSGYSSDEQITQEVQGVVDSVQVISETKRAEGKDGIVQVKVGAPIPQSWRDAAAKSAAGGTQVASTTINPSWIKAPAPPIFSETATVRRAKEGAYTSVIINAQGYGVQRSMSPKIRRPDGSEVWGTLKVDYDFISDHGIAAYARSLGEAYANPRAGDNPLVIRAIGRAQAPSKSEVVISAEDARYLLAEDRQSGFLSSFAVIFVIDGR